MITFSREPTEWLMADTLLAQSAIARLTSAAHTLIIQGPSYRERNCLTGRAHLDTEGRPNNDR